MEHERKEYKRFLIFLFRSFGFGGFVLGTGTELEVTELELELRFLCAVGITEFLFQLGQQCLILFVQLLSFSSKSLVLLNDFAILQV